ncbi:MAG: iron-containing alcohol dehydrogenase [Clostridia bacterium]|nr:iron-containing alcohol dehydrogenase [Clostridia bacterium]
MFSFYMPVRIVRREGALAQCGEVASSYGKRCLVLTSGSAAEKSGALTDALAALKAAKVEATVYPYISQNPTMAECVAAAEAADMMRVHSILAIGGGSVMDAAKATAWMTTNHVGAAEQVYGGKLRHAPLPLMLCGTTAGTGSEVSAVAVITDDSGKKRSLKNENCYAKWVFADPRYTDSMPRAVTVSTALDALAHAVEGYLSPACDDTATLFAEKALPLLASGLSALCEHDLPDTAARDALFDGALYAGFVLNACGTAFPHPMGYVLTEQHGVPHGQACAVFMRELLDAAKLHAPARADALFALCGGEEALCRLLDTLVDVRVTMDDEQLAACAVRFADLPHYAHVPGGYDGERAVALCRKLFGKN